MPFSVERYCVAYQRFAPAIELNLQTKFVMRYDLVRPIVMIGFAFRLRCNVSHHRVCVRVYSCDATNNITQPSDYDNFMVGLATQYAMALCCVHREGDDEAFDYIAYIINIQICDEDTRRVSLDCWYCFAVYVSLAGFSGAWHWQSNRMAFANDRQW